ncbi:unnamed protein product [Phaedon cochleariae]|uniref:Elongator complex protein 5 n=1 Tax=Phaedon cochleariae TaxID=80249 RepID=A0A9P0DEM6_PHACE|nr:unnamed protein product [Phaedon cochleariae]
MLRSHLTNFPFSKFVIIQDTLQERGKPIFDFVLKTHLERSRHKIHYFVFHENFSQVKSNIGNENDVILHDFVTDSKGWNYARWGSDGWDSVNTPKVFEEVVKNVNEKDVVFVDSLAHVIYLYGLAETYRLFSYLKVETGVAQIITVLHLDLLMEDVKAEKLFEHLCTFSLHLDPKFNSDNGRIQYVFKKLGGKIIKEIEEYWFEDGILFSKKIERLDPKKLLEKSTPVDVNPETLSTFKIALSDKDKASRDSLVLPYLPNSEQTDSQDGGRIFYQFDEIDDWDEEDPDDDLDI